MPDKQLLGAAKNRADIDPPAVALGPKRDSGPSGENAGS